MNQSSWGDAQTKDGDIKALARGGALPAAQLHRRACVLVWLWAWPVPSAPKALTSAPHTSEPPQRSTHTTRDRARLSRRARRATKMRKTRKTRTCRCPPIFHAARAATRTPPRALGSLLSHLVSGLTLSSLVARLAALSLSRARSLAASSPKHISIPSSRTPHHTSPHTRTHAHAHSTPRLQEGLRLLMSAAATSSRRREDHLRLLVGVRPPRRRAIAH